MEKLLRCELALLDTHGLCSSCTHRLVEENYHGGTQRFLPEIDVAMGSVEAVEKEQRPVEEEDVRGKMVGENKDLDYHNRVGLEKMHSEGRHGAAQDLSIQLTLLQP